MLFKRIDHSLNILAMDLNGIEEVEDLIEGGVGEDKHVLGESLNKAHKATLGIEPSVCSQLLVEGLQGFDDAGHTEGVVALGTIEGTNDEVDDTQVEYLSSGLFNSYALLFLFKALHELFSISILASHNIADTEVCQYDGSYAEQIVHLTSYEWFVVPDSITVLVLLKEENVCDV